MELQTIGKYEVISTLGRGSMGVVYKAQDPEIGRMVAIKTLRAVLMRDDPAGNEALKRFKQESRSAGKLRHPNIITIFEVGRTDSGSPYIVMDFIEGHGLEEIIKERCPLEAQEALHYLAQIASAIDYAHSQAVIHRDIKPSNVLVDHNKRPFLLDFGVAKLSDTSLTPAGMVVGTPSYMSPEQIRGDKLDGSTDHFALAVMAFELFTGSRPFAGKDFTTVVNNIMHNDPLTFQDLGIDLPADLQTVLHRGLEKDKGARYGTASEFVDRLAEVYSVVVDGSGVAGGFFPGAQTGVGVPTQAVSTSTAAVDVSGGSAGESGGDPAMVQAQAPAEAEETPAGPKTVEGDPAGLSIGTNGSGAAATMAGESAAAQTAEGAAVIQAEAPPEKDKSFVSKILGFALAFLVVVALVLFLLPESSVDEEESEMAGVSEESEEQPVEPEPEPEEPVEVASSKTTPKPSEPVEAEPKKAPEPEETKPPVEVAAGFTPRAPSQAVDSITSDSAAKLASEEIAYLLEQGDLNIKVLRAVAGAAGVREDTELTKRLVDLSSHRESMVRIEAIKSLNKPFHRKQPDTRDALLLRLADDDFLVRGFAAKILGSLKDPTLLGAFKLRLEVEQDKRVVKVLKAAIAQLETGG